MQKKYTENTEEPKIWISLRVSRMEKAHLDELASIIGTSRSEYLRRRFFGRKPIIAHTDVITIRELRRIGGLLKHNFETMREAQSPKNLIQMQEDVLQELLWAVRKIGVSQK